MSWDFWQPMLCRLLPRHERSPNLRGGNVTPCMVHAPPKSALHNDATPSRTTVFHAKMCRTAWRRFLSKSPDACARTTARAQACNVKCPNTAQETSGVDTRARKFCDASESTKSLKRLANLECNLNETVRPFYTVHSGCFVLPFLTARALS